MVWLLRSRPIKRGTSVLSAHSVGVAFDINCKVLTAGRKIYLSNEPDFARLIEILRKHGFIWGGWFTYPIPMHFQLYRFDAAAAAKS